MSNESTTFSEGDAEEIKSITHTHIQAVLDHDPDAFMATCAADIALLPPGTEPVLGLAAGRSYMDSFPTPTQFTVEINDVEGHGDLAFARGSATATFEDGGATLKWLAIYRKQSDGSWKMVRDIWNANEAA